MTPAATTALADAVIDGVDVDTVAATVLACPGVAGLDGGQFGEVASYLPGREVPGVVVSDDRVMVQIRSRWAVPAPELAASIRAALDPLTRCRAVDVVIADIDDPPGPGEQPVSGANLGSRHARESDGSGIPASSHGGCE